MTCSYKPVGDCAINFALSQLLIILDFFTEPTFEPSPINVKFAVTGLH